MPGFRAEEKKEELGLLPIPGLETFAGPILNRLRPILIGIIFLNQMPNPPPLRDFLGDLPAKLSRYDLDPDLESSMHRNKTMMYL